MIEGTLQFVPKGWQVVPEDIHLLSDTPSEPLMELLASPPPVGKFDDSYDYYAHWWKMLLAHTPPPLTAPPMLRWEGLILLFYKKELARVSIDPAEGFYSYEDYRQIGEFDTLQEARRAAEKALGFPDGLVCGNG